MPALTKKIARQKALGNKAKVNQLQRLKKPQMTGGLKAKPPAAGVGPVGSSTGSYSEAAANQPTSPQPSNPNYSGVTNQAELTNYSSYNPASGQPDPRDSNYWANLAKLQATTQQQYAGKQLEQSQADTAYGTEVSQRGEQRRRGVRDTAESLIGTGLLRSGYHNRRQTEDTIDYTNVMSGLSQSKADTDAQRKAQMDAILANLGIEEQGLYSDAVGRYAEGQAKSAAEADALAELAGAGAPTNTAQAGKRKVTQGLRPAPKPKKPKKKKK